jgi:hypothetical protein
VERQGESNLETVSGGLHANPSSMEHFILHLNDNRQVDDQGVPGTADLILNIIPEDRTAKPSFRSDEKSRE